MSKDSLVNLAENMQAHAFPQGLLSFRVLAELQILPLHSELTGKKERERDSWKWRRIKTILFATREITFTEQGRDK